MSIEADPLTLSVPCPRCSAAPYRRCRGPNGLATPVHQGRTTAALMRYPAVRAAVLSAVAAELLTYAASTPGTEGSMHGKGREDGRADAAEYVRRLADEAVRGAT